MPEDRDDVKANQKADPRTLESIEVRAKARGTIVGEGGRIIHVDPDGVDEARTLKVHPSDAVRLLRDGLIEGGDEDATDPDYDADRLYQQPGGVLDIDQPEPGVRAAPLSAQEFTAGAADAEDSVEGVSPLASLNSTLHPQDLGKVKVKVDGDEAAPAKRGRPPKAQQAPASDAS